MVNPRDIAGECRRRRRRHLLGSHNQSAGMVNSGCVSAVGIHSCRTCLDEALRQQSWKLMFLYTEQENQTHNFVTGLINEKLLCFLPSDYFAFVHCSHSRAVKVTVLMRFLGMSLFNHLTGCQITVSCHITGWRGVWKKCRWLDQ